MKILGFILLTIAYYIFSSIIYWHVHDSDENPITYFELFSYRHHLLNWLGFSTIIFILLVSLYGGLIILGKTIRW